MKKSFFARPEDGEAVRPSVLDLSPYVEEEAPVAGTPVTRRAVEKRADFPSKEEQPTYRERGERGDYKERPKGDFKGKERKPREIPKKEAPANVVYGIHPIEEALEAGTEFEKIYLRRVAGAEAVKGAGASLETIEALAKERNIPLQWVPIEKLDRLARWNTHQGAVGVVGEAVYVELAEVLEREPKLILVLDGVTDVRNFGAIARSAECAGADAIVISSKNSAPINGESMKASAGALSRLSVVRVGSLRNAIKTVQLSGIRLVGASEKGSESLYGSDLTGRLAVIMGSEERGLSTDVWKMCDARVAIPLKGQIESLNVSAAAAVVMYEILRQNQ